MLPIVSFDVDDDPICVSPEDLIVEVHALLGSLETQTHGLVIEVEVESMTNSKASDQQQHHSHFQYRIF